MKKFKPPSFLNGIGPPSGDDNRIVKKAKLSNSESITSTARPVVVHPRQSTTLGLGIYRKAVTQARRPLLTIKSPIENLQTTSTQTEELEAYFNVVWRKVTTKKHKTWDGDGILTVSGTICSIQDMGGKDIARGRYKGDALDSGSLLSVGNKECEIESVLDSSGYRSGRPYIEATKSNPVVDYTAIRNKGRAQFKNPLLDKTVMPKKLASADPEARHDPQGHNALVLSRPPASKLKANEKVVDVVVDPFISQFLRPHQREGVSFLYDCIMRFKDYEGAGAILADEMGLGKTLQTIALVWTLLKQHFLSGEGALARKALIVCPVTLANNWKKEFRKWLGQDRVGVFVVDSKANLRDFLCGKVYQVMIIGYEKLRLVQETDELKTANFDIIICDEGHKLKSANNKSAQAIKALKTTRRIILSGTPIQNDLGEFFVMIDFVNPGLLGTYQTFRKEFENPILKARLPGASKSDKDKGLARSAELSRLTNMFILRRTAELLSGYLPPKTEYVVFCQPTSLQVTLHKALLKTPALEQCLGGQDSAFQLKGITHLKKICNSPRLLSAATKNLVTTNSAAKQSGKLLVLERFLKALWQSGEKVVLVSQFTQTLQILQELLESHGMTHCRLDGTLAANKRQTMVEKFNRSNAASCFAFLLSAKSGGCGLNLIGASRLILYDTDWNPSVDLQAMARVHRDGQTRPVFIYRFLTTGMIDEKIYQRQVTKQGLSDSLMDSKASGSSFSLEELRDLFRCHEDLDCLTHDMLLCSCKNDGLNQVDCNDLDSSSDTDSDEEHDQVGSGGSWIKASQVNQQEVERKPRQSNMKALRIYDHIAARVANADPAAFESVLGDKILQEAMKTTDRAKGSVSYVFVKKHGIAPPTLEGPIVEESEDSACED